MLNPANLILIPALLAMCICAAIIPVWIKICHNWHLFEQTNERKIHTSSIPSMGGLAIFAGMCISYLLFSCIEGIAIDGMIMTSLFILFFTGFFDDLHDLPAMLKFTIQIACASLIAAGGTKFTSLFGLAGMNEIPVMMQIPVTVLFIVLVTNAFNLIDGIDGLAGMLGLMGSFLFGILFYVYEQPSFALLSFALAGSLAGFLLYNFQPAKIFMGDTGSLITGFILAVQAVALLQSGTGTAMHVQPAVIFAVLFIPVYDVIRVIMIRVLTRRSPFSADRNHIHHMMIGVGFSHRTATLCILFISTFFFMMALLFESMNINLFVVLCFCAGMIIMNKTVMSFAARVYVRMGGRLITV